MQLDVAVVAEVLQRGEPVAHRQRRHLWLAADVEHELHTHAPGALVAASQKRLAQLGLVVGGRKLERGPPARAERALRPGDQLQPTLHRPVRRARDDVTRIVDHESRDVVAVVPDEHLEVVLHDATEPPLHAARMLIVRMRWGRVQVREQPYHAREIPMALERARLGESAHIVAPRLAAAGDRSVVAERMTITVVVAMRIAATR